MPPGDQSMGIRYNSNYYNRLQKLYEGGLVSFGFPGWWRMVAQRYLELAKEEAPESNLSSPELQNIPPLKERHILNVINQFSIEVGSAAPYAPMVHWGSIPHWMPTDLLRKHIVSRALYVSVGLYGTPPNPWLLRAADRLEEEMPRLTAELDRRLQQAMSGVGNG